MNIHGNQLLLEEIKKGDEFVEVWYGFGVKYRALEDGYLQEGYWNCSAVCIDKKGNGEVVDFRMHDEHKNHSQVNLKIYRIVND